MKHILMNINSIKDRLIYPVDFHIHTDWTDGENSITEMYDAAKKCGLKAILFSEHVRHTSGDWYESFADQVNKIDDKGCKAFVGAEAKAVDFSGKLDCTKAIINRCDLLMGVVHRFPGEVGNIKKNKATLTCDEAEELEFELMRGLLKFSPIDILGHPFGMTLKRFKKIPNINKVIEIIKLDYIWQNFPGDLIFLVYRNVEESFRWWNNVMKFEDGYYPDYRLIYNESEFKEQLYRENSEMQDFVIRKGAKWQPYTDKNMNLYFNTSHKINPWQNSLSFAVIECDKVNE